MKNTINILALRLSAWLGNVYAQYGLAIMYNTGNGVPQSYANAEKWCRKAAEQGYADAQFDLGYLYYKSKDYFEAVWWYHKAAEQGHADAKYNLRIITTLYIDKLSKEN